MEHAWCRDVARDERVRAAEDERTGPLPTLKEAIASPFAEAAERSSTVSKTVEGQSGMRTERVTLEVTHDASRDDPRLIDAVRRVAYAAVAREFRYPGESVRVVEDDRILAASKKLIEVDQEAALRGFDTTTFQRLWISTIARVLGLELARPPRSKCDNPGDGSIPSPGILASPALVEAHQQIAALTAERDAAIRDRDEIRQSWLRLLAQRNAALDDADALRQRVAALEAASGGGEGEPVALSISPAERDGLQVIVDGVIRHGNGFVVIPGSDSLRAVESLLARHTTAPPQPRGWLTQEERNGLGEIATYLDTRADCRLQGLGSMVRVILTRSSPPEVVLPDADCSWCSDYATVWRECLEAVRSSLAAAGVAVKEAT